MTEIKNESEVAPEQIDKQLVARTIGQIGEQRDPFDDGNPEMRYWNIAANNRYENVHRALFIDAKNPHGPVLYGWTNDERSTWKIEDVGENIQIAGAEVETADSDDPAEDADAWAQEWVEIILSELRHDADERQTSRSVTDEIEFIGSKKLRLEDRDGRRADFEIELV